VLSGTAAQLGPQELPEAAGEGDETMVSAGTVPGVVVGVELARSLQVEEGDLLRLVALGFSAGRPKFRYASLRITGLFDTGFAEFDRSWMVLERKVVHNLVGGLQSADLVEITTARLDQSPEIAERAQEVLGEAYVVTDAHDLNRDLFDALELQQRTLFLLLGLIVAVSTFNTASTLVVLVRERMRDIGVLATLGISPRGLTRIFLLYGTLLGAVGTALGVAIGALASWVLTTYRLIRFSPEVADIYFLSSVSFKVEPLDVAAIVGFSLAITFLACLFPAVLAGRVDPATALRYE
jgi:lipoprotein-releasing system permease protein